MFDTKIEFLPKRSGERYASALTYMNLTNKVYRRFGNKSLSNYIKKIINKEK